MKNKRFAVLCAVTAALLACLPWTILGWAPAEARLGGSFRLLFLHLPLAWWGLFSLFTVFAGSILYLVKNRDIRHGGHNGGQRGHYNGHRDGQWTEAAAETGVLFMALAVISGMIWAKLAWGVWWRWEPKLFTALLLCLMYAACVLIQRTRLPLQREKKLSAVIAVAAFVNVPFIFISAGSFQGGAHPPNLVLRGGMAAEMLGPLAFSLLAFGLLWLCLTLFRLRHIRRRDQRRGQETADSNQRLL